MPDLRSIKTTMGRSAAHARALWRATGVQSSDFGKPIIAVANSFTQFVPGRGDQAFQPVGRERYVSRALRAYAALTTSAADGAFRDPAIVERLRRGPTAMAAE